MLKFGIQNGLNVARLGLTEDQILTACSLADKTGYHSIWYMDHSNVPQWSNAIVNDPWVMLAGIAAVTNNVELGTCVTDALRRHPSNIALASITLDRLSKGLRIKHIKYKPIKVSLISKTKTYSWIKMSLLEGKNREIRNIFESLNITVTRLIRISYGAYKLGSLERSKLKKVKIYENN